MSGTNAPPALTVSANGQGVVSDQLLNTFVQGGALLANLRAFVGLTGMTAVMIGYTTPSDGGQGAFVWNASAIADDDGGVTTIQPNGILVGRWLRLNFLISGAIDQPATGEFYADMGATIDRLNDRVFVGGASTVQAGNNTGQTPTWLGASAGGENGYMDTLSQVEIISTNGGVATSFGARTSDIATARGNSGAFGITSYGQNDAKAGTQQQVWAAYMSAVRLTAGGTYTAGLESDVTTTQAYVASSAYDSVPTGITTCYTAAAGGESALDGSGLLVNPTSAALTIFPAGTGANAANPIAGTGAIFGKGIVFQSNSIVGTDGSFGNWGTAIEMAKGHSIVWATNVGVTSIGGMIRSDNVSGDEEFQTRAVFTTSGFTIVGVEPDLATEQLLFQVTPHSSAGGTTIADYASISPAASGGAVIYGVGGSDTDIDLQLQVKGAGVVWLGAGAETATTPGNFSAAHWLQIKDGAGTVYYIPLSASTW